jgi:cell division protein FtsL
MSSPARALAPTPARRPSRPARSPARPPAKHAPAKKRESVATVQARRRMLRRRRAAFWLFAGLLVSLLVIGTVTLNALAVQTTYHIHLYQQVVSDLSSQQVQLTNEQATLSAPGRVAAWAQANGMVMPGTGHTVVLAVPGVGTSTPDGGGPP